MKYKDDDMMSKQDTKYNLKENIVLEKKVKINLNPLPD